MCTCFFPRDLPSKFCYLFFSSEIYPVNVVLVFFQRFTQQIVYLFSPRDLPSKFCTCFFPRDLPSKFCTCFFPRDLPSKFCYLFISRVLPSKFCTCFFAEIYPVNVVTCFYTPAPRRGRRYTVLPLSILPSVQDIFRRIFLSNYRWQKSNIWSQASYRYPILWEVFLDLSDSYFLFADLVGFYTYLTYMRGYHK